MRYRTIVADPPWPYNKGFAYLKPTGRRHTDGLGKRTVRPLPYPSMTLEQIGALPVPELAEDHARLFLWTTNHYLPDALGLIERWGFTYQQLIVWHKRTGGAFTSSVAPNCAEFLLVTTRGRPGRRGTAPTNVIRIAPSSNTHSRKPDAFLDLVEQVSHGPYLELFARRQRLGWDTWGNEALPHVEMPA